MKSRSRLGVAYERIPGKRQRKPLWLVGAFAFCFITGGWIWRGGSYQEYLEAGFHWGTLPLIAGVAFSLSWILDVGIIPSALMLGSVFPNRSRFGLASRVCWGRPSSANLSDGIYVRITNRRFPSENQKQALCGTNYCGEGHIHVRKIRGES